jgi:hypothetical protein
LRNRGNYTIAAEPVGSEKYCVARGEIFMVPNYFIVLVKHDVSDAACVESVTVQENRFLLWASCYFFSSNVIAVILRMSLWRGKPSFIVMESMYGRGTPPNDRSHLPPLCFL